MTDLPLPLRDALAVQSGVTHRRQALAAGLTDNDLRRLLRRRAWVALHPGVYVTHTGPPTWLQRAWAAVLYAAPAALSHHSALRADDGPGRREGDDRIHVAIDRSRSLSGRPGLVLQGLAELDRKVRWSASPPRVRIEEAALDVAAAATDDLDAIGVLSDAVRSRRTTAERLQLALASRTRIARRGLLEGVLTDVAAGTCSVLEREYLTRVERAHGLPTARRQVRESAKGTLYRDVDYQPYGLDGRLFHERMADRDRDLERDLDAALTNRASVRLGWGQVHQRPCVTAGKLAHLLRRRGWHGHPRSCPDSPEAPRGRDSGPWLSPGDSHGPPSGSRSLSA